MYLIFNKYGYYEMTMPDAGDTGGDTGDVAPS